jgi:hypothetical protein
LKIIVGDTWVGGMAAAFAPDRPSLLVDGRLELSPWIDQAVMAREGALAVWWSSKTPTAPSILEYSSSRSDGQIEIDKRSGKRRALIVYYAFITPDEARRTIARQLSTRPIGPTLAQPLLPH